MAETLPDCLFLANGGAMGSKIAGHDWSLHPLGTPNSWSPAFRTALSMVLNSGFPSYVIWGKEFFVFYNDAYVPILGSRAALGQGRLLAELWPEVAETACSIAQRAFAGETTYFEDMPFLVNRHGYPEQTYFTFSYSPIRDEHGVIQGVLGTVFETTEKVIALAKYKESEERYRLSLEASGNIGTWTVDPETKLTTVDELFARAFEVDTAVARAGKQIEHFTDKIHPDDRPHVLSAVAHSMETEEPYEIEYRIPQQSGEVRWVTAKGKMFEDATTGKRRFAGVAVDITERKKIEEKLRDTQAWLAAVFEILPVGVAVVDVNGKVELSNQEMHRYLPTRIQPSLDEARHSRWCAYHADGRLYAREEFPGARALHGERVVPGIEMRYTQDDGAQIWTQVAAVPIRDDQGRITGQVAVVTNVDTFKRTEEALRLSEEKYRTLFNDMAKSNRHLNEFLAVLAHELRNPLAPILTGLELMRMRPDSSETVARVREMIERQANQMVHLIDDLLDIARVTNGKIEIKKKLVDVNSIALSAVETSLPTIEGSHHELNMGLSETPLLIHADFTRIAQVIGNLLTNAAKYTPKGGKIKLLVSQDADQAIISVQDNGIGLPSESLESVFEMFSQVQNDMERSQGGLGIGLALVRNLVHLHDGTVSATSEGTGKGSTFIVRLPLAEIEVPSENAIAPSQASELASRPLRILVVDDNGDAAQSLTILLKAYGHDVRMAHEGIEALEIASQFQPEVVFLDIGLPGMTGYAVARRLREIEGLKNTRLVAVTGWGAETDRAHSREAGFDRHFTKPLSPAAVVEALNKIR
ncbi:PAS domain S-box protein [Noviherbaspirillum sp. CPCC 100848]|uniref:histidine kinase n=1 Tax=Noviherbaspirillum album TaxID=3080276 RepID=A0ABU6JJ65_9BURK|nr:ATP-binding protein [Noviherbaspirillum sp. CPCC 100848]MEC4723727.1 PAS domain S-box protein [Noviherbaspirillum sp. CPCC 100848]